MTGIDGVDIHFIHVRSRHPNALPRGHRARVAGLGVRADQAHRHRSPIRPAYGGRAEDAFDVVIPSLPGYGFSARPTEAGWGLERIGRALDVLMKRLGYARYVAQGGDWGAGIVQAMGRQAPAGLLGIHTNLPAVIPTEVGRGPRRRACARRDVTEQERAVVRRPADVRPERRPGLRGDDGRAAAGRRLRPDGLPRRARRVDARASGVRAAGRIGTDPDAVADERRRAGQLLAVLADEHRGLVGEALLGEPRTEPHQRGRAEDRRDLGAGGDHGVSGRGLSRPRDVGTSSLPQPRSTSTRPTKGGHFAAWEQPELFAGELRAAFRSLRSAPSAARSSRSRAPHMTRTNTSLLLLVTSVILVSCRADRAIAGPHRPEVTGRHHVGRVPGRRDVPVIRRANPTTQSRQFSAIPS